VKDTLDKFIRAKRLQGLSEKTLCSYRDILTPFIKYCGCRIEELSLEQVFSYFDSVLSKGRSKATYATYCRNIKTFLKFCREKGYTDIAYEEIIVPKAPRRAVRILSPEDVGNVLTAHSASGDILSRRNMAILALMYDSGLRQSEVCNLTLKDIHFPEHYAVIHGKGDKERYVPLGNMTLGLLKGYLSVRPASELPYVFLGRCGKKLSENAVKLFVGRLSKDTGVDFSSHKLRHNFATNYCIDHYEDGGQVDIYKLMHLMGHENIKTTEIYLHFALDIMAAKESYSHLDTHFPDTGNSGE